MFVFKKRKKKPGFVYICDMRLTYFPVNLLWPIYSIRRCRSVKVKHSLKKYDLTRSESTLSVLLDAKMKADRRRPNDLMFLVCRIHLKHADNYMHCSAASLYYYILYTYIVGAKHVFDPRDSCESSAIFPRVLLRPFPDSLMKASLFAAVFIFNVFFSSSSSFFFFAVALLTIHKDMSLWRVVLHSSKCQQTRQTLFHLEFYWWPLVSTYHAYRQDIYL